MLLISLIHVATCQCQDPRTTLCVLQDSTSNCALCTQQFCCRFAMQHCWILHCIHLEVFSAVDNIYRLTESILKMEVVHSFETSEHSATSRCRTQEKVVICPSISLCNDQNTLRLGQGVPRFRCTTRNTSTDLLLFASAKLRCDHQTAGSSLVVLLSAPNINVALLQRNVWRLSCLSFQPQFLIPFDKPKQFAIACTTIRSVVPKHFARGRTALSHRLAVQSPGIVLCKMN